MRFMDCIYIEKPCIYSEWSSLGGPMAKTLGLQPIGFLEQVSTKWLSRLSAITETPISHGNFSLEIKYKISKKGYY